MKKFILVVIDDEASQESIVNVLGERYETASVSNGLECLKSFADKWPDLILMDADTPVANGYQTAKVLKSREDTKDIPIILLTIDAYQFYSGSGLESIADAYINKPLLPDEMLSRIKELLH